MCPTSIIAMSMNSWRGKRHRFLASTISTGAKLWQNYPARSGLIEATSVSSVSDEKRNVEIL